MFGCSRQTVPTSTERRETTCYKVYKIDTVGGYYCIYALHKGVRYQIVSKRWVISSQEKGEKIEVNGRYNFILSSLRENSVMNGVNIFPSNYLHIGFTQEDGSVIFIDDGATDLHYPLNVKGLYMMDN